MAATMNSVSHGKTNNNLADDIKDRVWAACLKSCLSLSYLINLEVISKSRQAVLCARHHLGLPSSCMKEPLGAIF